MENPAPDVLRRYYERFDEARRHWGICLERLGFGPITTPSRCRAVSGANLRAYQAPDRRAPIVLIVPAPVKASYIWDMAPELSPVRAMCASGFQVYLVEWSSRAQESSACGISACAYTTLWECITAICEETGQRHAFLAGHSLGGTFAAIFASLHPACVRGLVALEAPIAFEDGTLTLAASFTSAEQIDSLPPVIPGTMLNELSSFADPYTYQVEPWIDWLASAYTHASGAYLRVRRWTLDESPWPKLLFKEVLTFLYRENRFVTRRLHVGSRLADPQLIVAPILVVSDPRSRIVPPRSIEAYRTGTRCDDLQMLEYPGDIGVVMQHVGVLAGHNAHSKVWPQILSWLRDRA